MHGGTDWKGHEDGEGGRMWKSMRDQMAKNGTETWHMKKVLIEVDLLSILRRLRYWRQEELEQYWFVVVEEQGCVDGRKRWMMGGRSLS